MRFIFLIGLISFNVAADTLGNFEKYKNNLASLSSDIKKLEMIVQKDNEPLFVEMLDDMNLLKTQFDHISHPLTLKDLYQDSIDNKWANVQKMSKELISLCENSDTQDQASCKVGLEKMKVFILNSKLTDTNKDSTTSFIEEYLSQLNALNLINESFVVNFNKNANSINLKIMEASKVAVPEVVVVKPSVPKIPIASTKQESESSWEIGYILFSLAAIGLVVGGVIFVKSQKKKILKDFYTKIFLIAQKGNINLKVFGSLSVDEVELVKKIQMPLLNSIYLSRSVSNKAQVKFKNTKIKLSIEVDYLTSRSIQSVMELPKEKNFKDSLIELQAVVEDCGGELIYSNRFNPVGELIQSSLMLRLPR